jgi:hypothetical protein
VQDTIDRCLGLASQYNPLSVAKGVLTKAENCRIRRENTIEDRRGHALYASFSDAPSKSFTYLRKVVTHYGTKIAYDDGLGTFTDFSGTFSPPSAAKMRGVEANSNLYLTTSGGVRVFTSLSSASSANRKAGVPRALDPSYTLTGSTGFLDNNKQCAYRVTIQRTDANQNVITGYPSQRMWVTNSAGGARNVILTAYLPSEAAVGDVIQFYRTDQVTFDPVTQADAAGDEMGLTYQYELESADVAAGFITFTDSITDSLIGATLYTSPSQEGIAQANERPPLCKDMALFKGQFMFYVNTETKQRLYFTLVGAGSLGKVTTGDTTNTSTSVANVDTTNLAIGWKVSGTGIPASTTITNIVGSTVTLSHAATATAVGVSLTFVTNQTITLAGTTYSFGTTEISSGAGSPQVQVSSSTIDTVKIDETARSLVRVINRYASNTSVYAYYLSGPEDLPGMLMVEERGVGAAAFTLQASNTSISPMIFPEPPVSPATSTKSTSSNEDKGNRAYYSKQGQPEHVPLLNYFDIGPSNSETLRVKALRDSLIFITEAGIYRLTGDSPSSFVVTPLDLTVFCKAADSVDVLSNSVYMLSDQGIVAISDTGVQVISRDIEPNLTPLLSISALSDYTTAVAYDTDREYRLSTISNSADTEATQTFVYNWYTKTWTVDTFGFTAAVVEKNADKLYFSKPGVSKLYRERKDFTDNDYADPEYAITISAISGDQITFSVSGVTPEEGWMVVQDDVGLWIEDVTVNGSDFTATMDTDVPTGWAAGAASLFPSVGLDVEWAPWTAGQPGIMKQVSAAQFIADPLPGASSASQITATFKSNLDADENEVPIESQAAGWGSAWGEFAWGGAAGSGFPTWVPMNKQYCALFLPGVRHRRAREKLALSAVSFTFDMVSERTGR